MIIMQHRPTYDAVKRNNMPTDECFLSCRNVFQYSLLTGGFTLIFLTFKS